jgi:hypothetical protein
MIVDIVVEHTIANYVQHSMMKVSIDDENFSNRIVIQMDHGHLSMFHVLNEMKNDVVHYLTPLLVMF